MVYAPWRTSLFSAIGPTLQSIVAWYHASGRALSSLLSPRLRTLPIEPSDFRPISITSNIKLTSRTLFYRGPLRDTLSERTSTRLCNNLLHVRGIGLKGEIKYKIVL